MKKQKKLKKLSLDKETLVRLQNVVGGVNALVDNQSEGPEICYVSECVSCPIDTNQSQ